MTNELTLNCNSVKTDNMAVTAEKEAFHFLCNECDEHAEVIVLRKDIPKLIKFLQEH